MTQRERAACVAYTKAAAALEAIKALLPDGVDAGNLRHDGSDTDPCNLLADALLLAMDAKGGPITPAEKRLDAELVAFSDFNEC